MNLNYLLLGILVLVGLVLVLYKNQENFEDEEQDDQNVLIAKLMGNIKKHHDEPDPHHDDPNSCVNPANIERVARVVAKKYCPVSDDFNPNNYIKKAEIENYCDSKASSTCKEKMPDMSKYVLKSSLPPDNECPACICPKIKVNGGLGCPTNKQKDCPPCPSVKRCNYEDCKKLVKCEDNTKPCPQDDKWCPACPKPSSKDLKCPKPQPCPKTKAICPELKCPQHHEETKCEIINKNIVVNKDLVDIIKDLSKGLKHNPEARDKLLRARHLLENIKIVDPNELKKENRELREDIRELERYIKSLRENQRAYRPNRHHKYPGRVLPNDESDDDSGDDEASAIDNGDIPEKVHFSHQTTVAPVTTVPATTINGKVVPTDSPNYAACPVPDLRINI